MRLCGWSSYLTHVHKVSSGLQNQERVLIYNVSLSNSTGYAVRKVFFNISSSEQRGVLTVHTITQFGVEKKVLVCMFCLFHLIDDDR